MAPALLLITLEPWLIAARAIAQGLLMRARRGRWLLLLSPVKILVMVAAGSAVVAFLPGVNGAVPAAPTRAGWCSATPGRARPRPAPPGRPSPGPRSRT